jgi:thymidylate synthase (FAD)
MKLIKPYAEILRDDAIEYTENSGHHYKEALLKTIYKQIERAGRTCYKSEDKITDDSAENFVKMLIARGHTTMLEHGTVYLNLPLFDKEYNVTPSVEFYRRNPYSKINTSSVGEVSLVTTNLRVIIENNRWEDLKFICTPCNLHEKRVSVRFVCDRGVSHRLKFVA